MNEVQLDHPDPQALAAFATGELVGDRLAEIEAHILECAHCWQALEHVPEDGLARLLQRAPSHDSTNPPGAKETLIEPLPRLQLAPPAPDAIPHGGPPELADHPRYQIVAKLGEGGMGVVYKAEHKVMDRPVALKVINKALTASSVAVERFAREVKVAARLSHPNIVTAHDADHCGSLHFLVMEFVEGQSLNRLVQERGPLPVSQACDYVRQTALGLQHAFERGMVHRDIKPHNLMLTPQGQVKILDFGLARLVSQVRPAGSLTDTGHLMGTPDFIAPEQARDSHRADIRADIYSLGCTLFYLLTGRPPFPDGTVVQKLAAHVKQPAPAVSALRHDVPAQVAAIVARMLAKDPGERFQTPAEAAEALSHFATSTQVSSAEKPAHAAVVEGRRNMTRKHRRSALVAVAGLLAIAVAGFVTFRIVTDAGTLVIEASDDHVQVLVKQGSNDVTIVDTKSHQKLNLRSGTYQLQLHGEAKGLSLSTDNFTLKRGEQVVVRVRLEKKENEAPSAPIASNLSTLPIAADWNFARDAHGQPVKHNQSVGHHEGMAFLGDQAGGQHPGRAWHREGSRGPIHAAYPVAADSPPGADGFALRTGPKFGNVYFPEGRDKLRANGNFSAWLRVQLQSVTDEPWQALLCRPERWGFIVGKNGRLDLRFGSVNNSLSDVLRGNGPDMTAYLGKWVDLGFSFQGTADDQAEDLVKVYLNGDCLGTFKGRGEFDRGDHLHLGADGGGAYPCDALFDRVIFFDGVLDDAGFRHLSRAPFAPKVPPGPALAMNGLAGLKEIQPVSFPPEWRQPRVFARVTGKGEWEYPRVEEFSHVMDVDLELKSGTAFFYLGEPHNCPWFALHDDDTVHGQYKCILWNYHTFDGGRWRWGHREFPLGQRRQFKLIVHECRYALIHEGETILTGHGPPANLTFRFMAERDTDAIIHSCAFRKLHEDDIKDLRWDRQPPWQLISKNLKLDHQQTAGRLEKARAGLKNQPVNGEPFVAVSNGEPLVWVPAGEFGMGADDQKQQKVKISRGFWMAKYETTQQAFEKIMGINPSRFTGSPFLPVDYVSWEDAVEFCRKLTALEKKRGALPAGYQYRLPTEAEWEYACRGGDRTTGLKPEDTWYRETSDWRTHEVGEKPANIWGLHDMQGNVWEWCLDRWRSQPEPGPTLVDPVHRGSAGDPHVIRGGAWWVEHVEAVSCFARGLNHSLPGGYRGFRVVLAPMLDELDLLSLVDIARDAVAGNWKRSGNGVEVVPHPSGFSRLALPVVPRGDYALTVALTRLNGQSEINVLLPIGPAYGMVSLWQGEKPVVLQNVNGASHGQNQPVKLLNGQASVVTLSVTHRDKMGSVAVTLDGTKVMDWQGPLSSLSQREVWRVPRHGLGLGAHDDHVVFHSARLRMLSGSSQPLDDVRKIDDLSTGE